MRLPRSLLVLPALALLCLGGCATPSAGSPGGKQKGASGGAASPSPSAPSSTQQPSPSQAPASASTSSSSSGSADPQASGNTRTASADGAGSATPGPAQTPDERRAAIDRRLNDSLGTFDEQLKKEQEQVAKERDARDAAVASAATTDSDADATKDGEGEPGSANTEAPPAAGTDSTKSGDKTSRPGDLKSDKDRGGTNSGAASGSGATARNIPDGSDDDIVARRLRKAAEQETDPELKDKLWKEYIEYKKNAGK